MRRRPEPVTGVPERLLRFVEAEWIGGSYAERLRAWHEARMEYDRDHGWPGDSILMLAEYSDLRRRAEGMPPWNYSRVRVRRAVETGHRHPEFATWQL